MREMKDSGVEWIGLIPSDWSIVPVKAVANCYGRIGFRGYTVEDLVGEGEGAITLSPTNIIDGHINLEKCSYLSWEKYYESPEIMVFKKDIVFVKTASVGKCAIYDSDRTATVNPQFVVFKELKCEYRFLYYCLISDIVQAQLNLNNMGGVIATITQKSILAYKIGIPCIVKQKNIADYLDLKCAAIDNIITKQEQIIEKLKEYKQSLITEGVTKGLDPNVEMKDSGSIWFGSIPTHWKMKRLKYVFHIQKDIAGEEGYTVLSITQRGIVPKDFSNNEGQFADSYANYQKVHHGDFAMNHMDLLTGWVDISKYDGVTSPDYRVFVLDDKENCCPEYYLYMMQMCYRQRIFYGLGAGVSGMGRWRLQADKFLNFWIPIPPREEQESIVNKLSSDVNNIDRDISKRELLINKMLEYKKALIYEVVTGKKEV